MSKGKSDDDIFDKLAPIIGGEKSANPWSVDDTDGVKYQANMDLLGRLLTVPVKEGVSTKTGRLAKAIDAWIANEFRRAGFPPDEVYPRLLAPRVLPREVGLLLAGLEKKNKKLYSQLAPTIGKIPRVTSANAAILGRAYVKQVDVVMAQWSTGPELMVSTKSMLSSFRNNLRSRFEEAYGDAKNLRGRYPLAALGYVMLLRSTVLGEKGTLDVAVDMLRKLQSEPDVYDSTALVIAEWDDQTRDVTLIEDSVPQDLSPSLFMKRLIEAVLERTPLDFHVTARGMRLGKTLGVTEEESVEEIEASSTDD